MDSDWVEVHRCTWPHEAALIKSVLASAGIEAIIPDEYTLAIQPFYAPALGGVRVLVPRGEAERARELLKLDDPSH